MRAPMLHPETINICGAGHDFDRLSGTGASRHRYPGTSWLYVFSAGYPHGPKGHGNLAQGLYLFSALLNRPSRPSYLIIPYPTGRFFRGALFQALRARLRSVSSLWDALTDISQQHLAKACCELSRRDGAIVAWHEVPGKTPPKEPSRRVGYDSCRCAHRF